jgi:hypothetical protein
MSISDDQEFEASPIAKIVENNSGRCVGLLYRWNNGETGTLWLSCANGDTHYVWLGSDRQENA